MRTNPKHIGLYNDVFYVGGEWQWMNTIDFHIAKFESWIEDNDWFDVICSVFSDDVEGVLKSVKMTGAKFTSIDPFRPVIDVSRPEINLDKNTI